MGRRKSQAVSVARRRNKALTRLRQIRRPLAPGFALDRDEINERLSFCGQCQARRESLEAMIRRVIREELALKRKRER